MSVSVVIADAHASIRDMLAVIIAGEGPYEVKARVGTGFDALKACRKFMPRLLIIDLVLPEMNGIDVLRHLRTEGRGIRVLVYSGTQHGEMVLEALRLGPHGFVDKRDSLATFRDALRAVMGGCSYFTPFASRILDEGGTGANNWGGLTQRERLVLQMVAEGMSSKQVADRLTVSRKTVEHHRMRLMRKLSLHDVPSLTLFAVRQGLVGVQ
jgi:DNA-binding NarL/FixJ family response regulator